MTTRTTFLTVFLYLMLFAAFQQATAQVVFVDDDMPASGDGSSWSQAFTTLQEALQLAELGLASEIWVAGGVYYPDETGGNDSNDRQATFTVVNGVTLVGGFKGTESHPDERTVNFHASTPTILDGDIDQNSERSVGDATASYHVVTITGNATLDGFLITGGNDDRAPSFFNANGVGGGVLVDGGASTEVISPVIRNTVLRDNSSASHGASIAGVNAGYTLQNVLITASGGQDDPAQVVAAASGRTNFIADASLVFPIVMEQVTIAGNGGQSFIDAEAEAKVTLVAENSIFYGNGLALPAGSPLFQEAEAILTDTILEQETLRCAAGISCTNVRDADPLFRTSDGFFSLQATSSEAIDRGNMSLLPPGLVIDGALRPRIQNELVDLGWLEGTDPVEVAVGVSDILLAAEAIDFGSVEAGQTRLLILVVTNGGTSPLDITAMVITGADAGVFVLEGTIARTLAPGEETEVQIQFSPTSAGVKNAVLTISSNDPDESTSVVTLTGLGTVSIDVETPSDNVPARFAILGAYPNPFRHSTTLTFDLPAVTEVEAQVFDLLGRLVAEFPAQHISAGAAQKLTLELGHLPAGVYVYRLVSSRSNAALLGTGVITHLD